MYRKIVVVLDVKILYVGLDLGVSKNVIPPAPFGFGVSKAGGGPIREPPLLGNSPEILPAFTYPSPTSVEVVRLTVKVAQHEDRGLRL